MHIISNRKSSPSKSFINITFKFPQSSILVRNIHFSQSQQSSWTKSSSVLFFLIEYLVLLRNASDCRSKKAWICFMLILKCSWCNIRGSSDQRIWYWHRLLTRREKKSYKIFEEPEYWCFIKYKCLLWTQDRKNTFSVPTEAFIMSKL